MTILDISHSEEIYSVSRLNREAKFLLENHFATMWVEGEISNFSAPSSGHWYFGLKDQDAQVRCAMFKPQNRRLGFLLKDGMQVLIKARVSLYEGRGEFQLLAEYLEEAGKGKLQQEFEALKKRLLAAGLFDAAHKKDFPFLPQKIGVITSPTGAAIRDILSVLKRRFPCVPIIIYPSMVQGEQAAATIANAIQTANRRKECDVLILARGGGSLEDLWPFNEEIVAQAIFQSELPIISGVGHEIDFTIADFVADQRAATPSAAAELITPDKNELLESLKQEKKQLIRFMQQSLQQIKNHLVWTSKHLEQQHPKRKLMERAQQLDLCEQALIRLQRQFLSTQQTKLAMLQTKLFSSHPRPLIREWQHALHLQKQQLENLLKEKFAALQQSFANLADKLDALSPLAVLKRGYAIAMHKGQVLRDIREIQAGDLVHLQLMRGELDLTVKNVMHLIED